MLVSAVTRACLFVVAVTNTSVYELWEQNLSFPRYRHICLRAPGKCACNAITRYRHNHVTGIHFRCPKSGPVTSSYSTCLHYTTVLQYSSASMSLSWKIVLCHAVSTWLVQVSLLTAGQWKISEEMPVADRVKLDFLSAGEGGSVSTTVRRRWEDLT